MLNSLNKKFVIAISVCFLCTSILFIAVFSYVYSNQVAQERRTNNERMDKLNKSLLENIELKEILFAISNDKQSNLTFDNNLMIKNLKKNNPIEEDRKNLINTIRANTSIYEQRYEAIYRAFHMVLIGAMIVVFALFIYWLLIRKFIIKPLDNLAKASEKIASGKYNTRIDNYIIKDNPDEIERLVYAFNEMADSLEISIGEIKQRELFQQSLIDAIPDGIRVIDEDYNVIAANKTYKKETMRKKLPVKCYKSSQGRDKPCDMSEISCPLLAIKNGAKKIKTVQKFDGNDGYMTINSAPLKIKGKNSKLMIVESIRNLSEDIRFSHQQKLSSIGLMASSIAHEMRNPLGSVRLIIDALLEKVTNKRIDKKEFIEYLQLISGQMENCINITERLLKLSRMPNDKLEIIDIKGAIEDVVALLDYEAKKHGVNVKTEFDKNIGKFKANESEIRMILLNLLQNAFHAMRDINSPEITIKTEIKSNKLIVSIIDNGKGIKKEDLSKIFDPFYSNKGKNKDVKGTGLGLTITKGLVEKFRGKIDVKSKIGSGTSFFLTFPVAKEKK